MWEAEPVLYWRVKVNGSWRFQKARAASVQPGLYAVEPPRLRHETESDEFEGESNE